MYISSDVRDHAVENLFGNRNKRKKNSFKRGRLYEPVVIKRARAILDLIGFNSRPTFAVCKPPPRGGNGAAG